MRIAPVTGDLPAVLSPAPPPPAVADTPRAPARVVAPVAAARGAGADTTADRRRGQTPLPVFDPPLIAQRAVLGLPIGRLVASLADERRITYGAASAMVDGEVDLVRGTRAQASA